MTTVADRAAARIARQAAAETLTGGGRVLRAAASAAGPGFDLAVEVALPLTDAVDTRTRTVQEHVRARTEHLTGRQVAPPRVRVTRLVPVPHPPGTRTADAADAAEVADRAPRTWSQRRLPAACLALAVTAASALLLWHALAPHPPAGPALRPSWRALVTALQAPGARTAGAVGSAVLGGWLLALALTPGHRRLLTLRTRGPVRAVLGRAGASRLVRAALAGVPALRVRSVRCTARGIHVRAERAFGDPDAVAQAATREITRAVEGMALGRTPRIRLDLAGAAPGRRRGGDGDAS
ncbi:DUF6286 domain-containing protein [Streptomyces sp. NPDC090077]|uniref:DUF6286 domain-containing protein n=1 Tax=Streptomyces sp. NPDC090077 TaxID=3365938 RepID=UPI00380A4488